MTARSRLNAFPATLHSRARPPSSAGAGKVVGVEGEGDLANHMRWIPAKMDRLTFPTAPAAGGAFLVKADLDRIHPKIARPPWEGMYEFPKSTGRT